MDDFDEIRIFAIVARLGSFTAAATEANLSLSAVSKKISRLEERVGAMLLRRTTRSVHLTEAGETFLEKCEQALRILEEAKAQVSHLSASPRGHLKIKAPASFGRYCVLPHLPEFLKRYPEITAEFWITSRFDSYDFDVLIRKNELMDDSIAFEFFAEEHLVLVASRAYLDARGTPTSPLELRQHNCLLYKSATVHDTLTFVDDDDRLTIPITGSFVSNSYDATLEAAAQGLGIACVPSYLAKTKSELVEVLPGRLEPARSFKAFYMKGKKPPKVQVFLDFYRERLANGAPGA
jgi:DNA-binding transcriptional LysR family regulator